MLHSLWLSEVGDKHLSNETVSISVSEVAAIGSKSWPGMLGKHTATEMKQSVMVKHCGCYVATRNAVKSGGVDSRSCQQGSLRLGVSLPRIHEH